MKNTAPILQAFENDKQYEIELISTYRIPYLRLVVYGVLTTDLIIHKQVLYQHEYQFITNTTDVMLPTISLTF